MQPNPLLTYIKSRWAIPLTLTFFVFSFHTIVCVKVTKLLPVPLGVDN